MFDPDLDAALVALEEPVDVTPLVLADAPPGRGDPAAALGFTGGGRQRVIPAAISRSVEALGRDIYGQEIVSRRIVELRADVAPGDSGGPVILADGTVGGVTFSESRSDSDVGYALSPIDVRAAVRGSLTSATPVDTGSCISPR
jgi:S1-C subfamily serine protease